MTVLSAMLLPSLFGCGSGPRHVLLQNKGSDTMVNLMQRMSEEYQTANSAVIVAVTGGGSGTGIKSLLDGTTDMANASRDMSAEERELAKGRNIDPHETIVAYDGLAIYVHKDNPVASMSFEDLRCIYAADGACNKWSQLSVTVDCNGSDGIVKVGRQNNSGTWEYFRDTIIGKTGRFTNSMDQSGTQQVVDVVSTNKCAIGYGGMGYHSAKVRFVCLSKDKGGECSEPTVETVKTGKYTFSRPLFVYTNGAPKDSVKEFLDWAVGEGGQKVALDAGFVPVSFGEAAPAEVPAEAPTEAPPAGETPAEPQ